MKKLFFVLFFPLNLVAQRDYPALIDSFMQAEVAVNRFNGNVLVAKSGKVVFQKAFGYRNYETRELLDNNSLFELASVSKQFTAMGILILSERKKLSLTDSLRKYFPELPYHNITIQHLLTHTSGLPAYEDVMGEKWDHKKIASNNDVIAFFAKEKTPIRSKPGTKWEYSNTAYVLLASIIERVSGLTFSAFMDANIFKPLKMTQSRVYNTRRSQREIIPNYAYGYVYSEPLKKYMLPDSLPQYDFVIYLDGIQGDGIINSTTGDLLKWDRALKNGTLLQKETQAAMLSAQATMDTASKVSYGYGVMIGKNEIGDYITHGGGWPGYATVTIRYLADDISIIVLSNNESLSHLIAGGLAYIVTDREVARAYEHKAVSIDSGLIERYLGNYVIVHSPTPKKIQLLTRKGKLYYRNTNGSSENELKPESATKFFSEKVNQQFEFILDASGKVDKAYLISSGMKKALRKVD